MHRSLLALLPVLGASFFLGTGCADPEIKTGTAAATAFTVETGDRFVASASPTEIVLKKKVDGATFPFDEKSLKGKAILIHPVSNRVEEGVYSRALSVRSEKDTYVIEGEPLDLEEMGRIAEDDIVRIYLDRNRLPAKPGEGEDGPVLVPENGSGDPVATMGGTPFPGFSFNSGLSAFGTPISVNANLTVAHKVEKANVSPNVLVEWSSDGGLEVGFRGQLDWSSTLEVGGKASGELFRSKTVETPSMLVVVWIGPVPVPITLHGAASASCSASGTTPVNLTVKLEAGARVAASLRLNARRDTAPSTWISAGRWPAEATGDANATVTVGKVGSASISCTAPRMELHTRVAGVAGPFVAVSPTATLSTSGTTVETKVSAGVAAGLFGGSASAEIPLKTFKHY